MRLLPISISLVALTLSLSAQPKGKGAPTPPMTLTIPGFPDGGQIPVKFSQAAPGVAAGEGTSPAMTWANVPAGTQSLFLHMHDMDLALEKLPAILGDVLTVNVVWDPRARRYVGRV